MLRLQVQEPQVVQLKHRRVPLLPVHQQAPLHGRPHLLRQVSPSAFLQRGVSPRCRRCQLRCRGGPKAVLTRCHSARRSLKMDRWKRKELKQMELGGNKLAQAFFEENGMYKDGRPDHEHPLHSRWKMELAARAETALRQELAGSK